MKRVASGRIHRVLCTPPASRDSTWTLHRCVSAKRDEGPSPGASRGRCAKYVGPAASASGRESAILTMRAAGRGVIVGDIRPTCRRPRLRGVDDAEPDDGLRRPAAGSGAAGAGCGAGRHERALAGRGRARAGSRLQPQGWRSLSGGCRPRREPRAAAIGCPGLRRCRGRPALGAGSRGASDCDWAVT